jgi:hypothetical protein
MIEAAELDKPSLALADNTGLVIASLKENSRLS